MAFRDTFGGQQDYLVGASWRIGPGGLFDFGRKRSAESRLSIAKLSSDKLLDDMTRQVVEAFTRWQSLADQLDTVKRALAAAEEGLRLAQQRKEFAGGHRVGNHSGRAGPHPRAVGLFEDCG